MRVQRQSAALRQGCWYVDSAHAAPRHGPLRGTLRADVCVVGGGMAGLSAALELAGAGMRVVVLEAMQVGWGASGRNGGQALAGYASEMEPFEQQLGRDAARAAWDMSIEALDLMRQRIDDHRIDCDWTPGAMTVAVTEAKARALRRWLDVMHSDYAAGHLEWTDLDATREWVRSERYVAGVYDPTGGHLHPLNYTLGLAAAAAEAGAQIFEDSEVVSIEHGSLARVRTEIGEVVCDHLLLACNANLGSLAPTQAARIMPVGTYIIATEPLDPALRLIRSRVAVCDTQFLLDYYRLTPDHRLLFGGRASYSTVAPRDVASVMRRDMLRVFPQLEHARVTHAWGGFVDISMNRAPDFGRIAPNAYYLQGFSGHGLALTGLAGKLAAEAIGGQASRFDMFARLRHRPFPGGDLLRTPALVLGMLWYRMREALGG